MSKKVLIFSLMHLTGLWAGTLVLIGLIIFAVVRQSLSFAVFKLSITFPSGLRLFLLALIVGVQLERATKNCPLHYILSKPI